MVEPAPSIAPCSSGEYDALLALLDLEFIFGKGRRLSLQQRFPAVLNRQRPQAILLAKAQNLIVSALAIKAFDWITPERSWRAAMVGMVYTRPEWRGRGMASVLLQAAQQRMRQESYDFAVLWTAQPDFYARLGWIGADCGVLGVAQTAAPAATQTAAAPDAAAVAFIETLRRRGATERAARTETSYASLPPPAEQLELLRGESAYALVGRRNDHGYLYEMLGEPREFPALWSTLAAVYATLYLNLQRDSAAERFFATQNTIRWQPQRLAMWLPLGATARAARFADWYIPFLDRI
ncbi:MAG: hypothetical protein A3F75_01950 [Betaproteobacteria bacterium RIFCSPLOWO2_12_FULL_64_23]|nr:MAG: hypothetical protein A3F75_01950 [Betaproteobacteria bacterium RIFCSPLOWO2_12_FULL_64_23]